MKNQLLDLKLLIVTSIVFISSVFVSITTSPKIIAVTTVVWVLNVAWCIRNILLSSGMGIGQIASELKKQGETSFKEKKYIIGSAYFMTFPLMSAVAVLIVIQVVLLFVI